MTDHLVAAGRGTRVSQAALALLGLAGVAWGAWLLLDTQDLAELRGVAIWFAGGVIVHDAVLAPLTLALTAVAGRIVPRRWSGAAASAAIVIGTVTVMAIPVLGGFGADYDSANTTYLDRDYLAGWLGIVVLTVVAVVGVQLGTRRRSGDSGT